MARQLNLHPALLVVVATLLGTFLRFFQLSSLAPEAWFDEVWFALRARELIQSPAFVVFYKTPWGGGNALMVYLTAAVQLFGFDGISASRFASAGLGGLAVPLAYACFKEVLGNGGSGLHPRLQRWAAALAALILAYLLYWVIVSRVGTEPSLAPAATLFCVWQLKAAKRKLTNILCAGHSLQLNPARTAFTGRAPSSFAAPRPALLIVFQGFFAHPVMNYVLAGVVAGLAQYNGPHARFILPLLAFIALHDLIVSHLSNSSLISPRGLIVGYLVTVISACMIAAPLIAFFIQNPGWLFARARITASVGPLNSTPALRDNLYFTLLSFNFVGSFDPLTNYPGLPMFDILQSVGFIIGHAWAFWALRRSALARELLGWEIIMVMPTLLTSGAPNFQRMIGFAPPAALLITIGWVIVWKRAGATRSQSSLGILILGFGIFLSSLYHTYTLLIRYPALSILPISYLHIPVRDARELIARAEAGERVFVSRHPEDIQAQNDVIAFEFLFPGRAIERLDFRQCLPLTTERDSRTNYLVLTNRDKVSVVNLYNTYPESKITAAYYWQDSGTWVAVPAGASEPLPPNLSHAQFDSGLRLTGYEWSSGTVAPGQSLLITLWWKAESDLSTDYTSFVHVGIDTVITQRDGQPCQGLFPTSHWRAGDLVRDSFAITFPPDAPPGDYPLALGWYTYPDFTRLPLISAETPLPDNRAIIATITVAP